MDDAPESATERADEPADAGPALPGFEAPATSGAPGYQVLARKYRPQTFEDLIGQEAMVRTLKNAFAAGRIAQAYMLTGVRGVGKTTTARLIARALNYETDAHKGPSVTLDPPGRHCAAIAKSSHVDVMELDAASRTGVADMREILDGVRYAPVSAAYKVYIIDEVHMLSTASFNALLKTLEEPPPHVKFIFATTEIRKVPVTVLSRCQRFDLKRVERDVLADHLARVCAQESAEVERPGLIAIARAAEGSVRDALSLLDQAIVQADPGSPVTEEQVRDMLGLADRTRVVTLLEAALGGRAGEALAEVPAQYAAGADMGVLMRDLLDHLHMLSRIRAVGEDVDLGEGPDTVSRLKVLAASQSLGQLARLWKVALAGMEDVRAAPDPVSATEMAVIRLMAAADLPGPEEAARLLSGEGAAPPAGAAPSAPAAHPTGPEAVSDAPAAAEEPSGPADLSGVVDVLAEAREIALKVDVERYVRPVSVKPGRLVFQPADGAPADLAGRLSRALQDALDTPWMVLADADARGGETLKETREREHQERLKRAARDPAAVRALSLFPGAEIVAVRPAGETGGSEDAEDAGEDPARQENRR